MRRAILLLQWKGKRGRAAAHKLVSKKDILGGVMERAKDYTTCLREQAQRIDQEVNSTNEKAKKIQSSINNSLTYTADLHQFRTKMEKLRDDLDVWLGNYTNESERCVLPERKSNPPTFHSAGKWRVLPFIRRGSA